MPIITLSLLTSLALLVATASAARDHHNAVSYERFPNYLIARTQSSVGEAAKPPVTMGGQPLVGFSGVWYLVAPAEGSDGPIKLLPEESLHQHYAYARKVDDYRKGKVTVGVRRPEFLSGVKYEDLAGRLRWWFGEQSVGGMCGLWFQEGRVYGKNKKLGGEEKSKVGLYSIPSRAQDGRSRPRIVYGLQNPVEQNGGEQVRYRLGCTLKELSSRFPNPEAKGNWELDAGDKKQSVLWNTLLDNKRIEFFACFHPLEKVFYLATSTPSEDKPYSTFHLCVRLADLSFTRKPPNARSQKKKAPHGQALDDSDMSEVLEVMDQMDPRRFERYAEVLQLDTAVANDPHIQQLFSLWALYEFQNQKRIPTGVLKEAWKVALRNLQWQLRPERAGEGGGGTEPPHAQQSSEGWQDLASPKIEEDNTQQVTEREPTVINYNKRVLEANSGYDIYEDEPEMMKYMEVAQSQRGNAISQDGGGFQSENIQQRHENGNEGFRPYHPQFQDTKEEYVKAEDPYADVKNKAEAVPQPQPNDHFNFQYLNRFNPPPQTANFPPDAFVGQVSYPFFKEQQRQRIPPIPMDVSTLVHEILDNTDLTRKSVATSATLAMLLKELHNSKQLVQYYARRLKAQGEVDKAGAGGRK